MSFEVLDRDLLGRIGKLATKSGAIETPAFLPVINPTIQKIPPREIWEKFRLKAVITNSYIIKRHLDIPRLDVHSLLDFPGVIMTDSGAYQLLRYGKVSVSPLEIVKLQEEINTDIAVILDIPTSWESYHAYAEKTVKETLKRAEESLKSLTRKDILWVGPVQGGRHLDLVASSAQRMAELPFHIYALGSPTEVMEHYYFETLVDMIMSAKVNLPPNKPLHLFGAGHPLIFSFAVALGCDLFDSAAYAIYAREGRYIVESGTVRLENLEYFPCVCPICSQTTPKELRDKQPEEREALLARHNLYLCLSEVNRVKQAIRDGRLWELLELRARSHPSLLQALKGFSKHANYFLRYTPVSKRRGLFIFGTTSLYRPEVLRHQESLTANYIRPEGLDVLLLLPQGTSKPFSMSQEYEQVKKLLKKVGGLELIHVCSYTPPFGVIPLELEEVFPLSQFEAAQPFDEEMKVDSARKIAAYLKAQRYEKVILHPNPELINLKVLKKIKGVNMVVTTRRSKPWSEEALQQLMEALYKTLMPLSKASGVRASLSEL
ncbi:MAG: tRNA guanosine(15) transglycosylase TgtA [Candidatus Bathyarchaeia archaeon]